MTPEYRFALIAVDRCLWWAARTEISRHHTRTAAESMSVYHQRAGRTFEVKPCSR